MKPIRRNRRKRDEFDIPRDKACEIAHSIMKCSVEMNKSLCDLQIGYPGLHHGAVKKVFNAMMLLQDAYIEIVKRDTWQKRRQH